MLPMAVLHLEASLLKYYVEKGIPVNTGPPWLREALENYQKRSLCVNMHPGHGNVHPGRDAAEGK